MNELDFDKCEVLKIDGEGFDNFHIKHRMPKLKKLTVDGFCCGKKYIDTIHFFNLLI